MEFPKKKSKSKKCQKASSSDSYCRLGATRRDATHRSQSGVLSFALPLLPTQWERNLTVMPRRSRGRRRSVALCVASHRAAFTKQSKETHCTSFVFLKQANILLSFPIANKVKQANLCES